MGDGDLEDDSRLRDVEGVGPTSRPGVRVMSPLLVGLWPSFANIVISGISENVLKQVSSMLVVSGPCIVDRRKSRPAWNSEGVLLGVGSARSKELPHVIVRGVVLSPLRTDFKGVFLGVLLGVLRTEAGGGGIRSESALPLLSSMSLSGDLVDLTEPGVSTFFGEMLTLFAVVSSCGTFSLSSMKSVKSMNEFLSGEYDSCASVAFSVVASSAMSSKSGLCCLLGLLLTTSLWKGEDGGPSTA